MPPCTGQAIKQHGHTRSGEIEMLIFSCEVEGNSNGKEAWFGNDLD